MSELDKLELYLKEHGIRYKRIDGPAFIPMIDGGDVGRHQIVVYDEEGGRKWDAICHYGSYGYEKGLLEIYGDIVDEEYAEDVNGWLTADDVIERVEKNEKNIEEKARKDEE